ncbi:DUF1616 domain-containing protein [Methanosphaera sp. WGK6]|uniref:DUF1616 domain-containing protein n=1 Tax=Methanosphaera sp. WGK6 TaxID=1561964 RepID=UPI00084C5802|nr:DUF1616 domain-containing protein [Methanosphaera sp. WGK6]
MKLVDKVIKGLLVTILIVAIISVIYLVVIHNPGEGYTEFYMLDHNNNTTDFPTNITQNTIEKINIGIRNQENQDMNYTVRIRKNQSIITQYNKTLKNNEESLTAYYVSSTRTRGDNQELNIELLKGNITEPYRTLKLRYNVI